MHTERTIDQIADRAAKAMGWSGPHPITTDENGAVRVWKWARERGWYWGKMEPGKTDWNSEYWAGQAGGEYIYVPDTGNFHDDLFQLFDKVLDAIEAKGGK